MNIRKPLFIAGAFILGLMTPAAAQSVPGLPIPTPDICLWSYCITYTNSTLMTALQQLTTQNGMFQNMTRNLGNLGNVMGQSITSEIGTLAGGSTQSSPQVAVTAAQALLAQSSLNAATISQINTNRLAADGAKSQAQVSNDYSAEIASEMAQNNALAAQQVIQHQNDAATETKGLGVLFGGGE